MMEIALAWLPWVGGVLIAIAIGAWFEGSKSYAIWLGYGGAVIAALAFAIHLQKIVWEQDKAIVTRTNLTMGFGAVLLNSPSPGQVTAWIRIKNSGPTTAYKVKGWQKFVRGISDQNPFGEEGVFENEAIIGAGQEINLSSTLSLTVS